MPEIHVHMLPTFLDGVSLSGSTAIVIDVLRATTTMIHALGHGARAVMPFLNVEDALAASAHLPVRDRLLGGERHGKLIPGFDLGNSPLDYVEDVVAGKTILFTTTNGTRALLQCGSAKQVFLGAFTNLDAVVNASRRCGADVHLVCAGTDGQLTAEDILFAGAAASELLKAGPAEWTVGSVQTQMAVDFYEARSRSPDLFRKTFFESLGAQNLLELGMERDVVRAMEKNLIRIVPIWNPESGEIKV
ncbi:2-phosphosulfolactate phosphatase [Planctomicrobium sp. SH661]|uniref:2-phosphosulfolactate phosphatase n=1 Tax=Planctomicrobium sp. SH661 TaxID=3448124 RepID=UPI003F5AE518